MKKALFGLLKGTLILTVGGMIARVMGFFFKLYLTGKIGAEGIGLIQLTMPISALVQAVYSGGLTGTVSSMVAAKPQDSRFIAGRALALGTVTGIFAGAGMWMCGPLLARLLGDPRIADCIRVIALSVPLTGVGAALKGYYIGLQQMRFPAASQMLEQVARIAVSCGLVVYFAESENLETIALLCTLGTACGELAGLCAVALPYIAGGRRPGPRGIAEATPSYSGLTSALMLRSMPAAAGKLAASLLTVAETALIPWALAAGGMSRAQGLATLGRVEGITVPLIMLPGMLCTSLSTVAVPAIASAGSDRQQRQEKVEICLQISIIMGFVMAAVFRGYAELVAYVTYPSSNIGGVIYGLAPCCIFAYPMLTLTGTMQALRLQKKQLLNTIFGYCLRIVLVCILAQRYGANGYMLTMIISYACICLLNIFRVTAYTNLKMKLASWCWWPALCYLAVVVTAPWLSAIISTIAEGSRLAILAMVALVGGVTFLLASAGLLFRLIRSWSEVALDNGQTKTVNT